MIKKNWILVYHDTFTYILYGNDGFDGSVKLSNAKRFTFEEAIEKTNNEPYISYIPLFIAKNLYR